MLVRADGSVRVLSSRGNRPLRYASGGFEEFPIEGENAGLGGLAPAPDGALWFAMARPRALGRLAAGRIEIFRLPGERALPFDVAVDAAGAVRYADITGFAGRLEGASVIDRVPVRPPPPRDRTGRAGPAAPFAPPYPGAARTAGRRPVGRAPSTLPRP